MSLTVIIIISVITAYALIMTLIFFIQDRLVFRTDKLKKEYSYNFDQNFEEYFIVTDDNNKINSLLFKSEISSEISPKGLIIYFHGNANNLKRWGKYSVNFTSLGYDVLMIDYRGYGKSSGIPTEELLYDDALTVWNWVKNTFKYSKHILYGRSLGAAVASNLAGKTDPDILIMETPFDNLNRALPAYLIPFKLKYKFRNCLHLPEVSCKKVIFHGTMDMLIPITSAKRLKPFLNKNDKMIIIKSGRHNNLDSFPLYHEELYNSLQ